MTNTGQPPPEPDPVAFFSHPRNPRHRRYEILRAFLFERIPAKVVAARFNCSPSAVYTIARDFRKLADPSAYFFRSPTPPGRPLGIPADDLRQQVIALRKLNFSVPDIKAHFDEQSPRTLSERAISRILKEAGFARLPRRTRAERTAVTSAPIQAPESAPLPPQGTEYFQCESTGGILCFLPWIRRYGIDKAIEEAGYPCFGNIPPLQAVLCFLALKLVQVGRISADDLFCMDRGLGLFAGLNVLPSASWLSSYSGLTTPSMNQRLFAGLSRIWINRGLVGDSANLEFITLPHWGDGDTLEKRTSIVGGRTVANLSAILAQDSASGLLLHVDSSVRRQSDPGSILEVLGPFSAGGLKPHCLVFDGRLTTYAGLKRLDEEGILFLTARRRGHKLIEAAKELPKDKRVNICVPVQDGTTQLEVAESKVPLRVYDGEVRQIALLSRTRHPTLLITNDFESSPSNIVRLYARHSLAQVPISDQLAFFHLNRLSSSMDIKVDFDLALTVLAYNLYRLLARDLPPALRHRTPQHLFRALLETGAAIRVNKTCCTVSLERKRNLPTLLGALGKASSEHVPWLGQRHVKFDRSNRARTPTRLTEIRPHP